MHTAGKNIDQRSAAVAPRVLVAVVLALVALAFCLAPSQVAWADPETETTETTDTADTSDSTSSGTTATETDAEPDEFQQKVEETAAAYDAATARVEELATQISENETKIAEIEEVIPEQQERTGEAMRVLYKTQNDPLWLVNSLLGTESLNDFLITVDGLSYINDSNVAEIERLDALHQELNDTRQALEEEKREADEQQAAAQQALEEAKAAREEAQRRAQEQAAREAAEAAAAAESLAQGQAAATELAESRAAIDAAASSSDGANWSSDKSEFVEEWTARINAYLAGSPLAGQGATFAEAAWKYGVDPRWSPAISNTESSKGLHCFLPHNAWGWGSSSWSSWEEAIDAHVAGLARGYGYTISVSAAQKYCPPTWQNWYSDTLAQMNSI